MLKCLVDNKHLLHYGHGGTYSETATKAGVNLWDCQTYRFNLVTREIFNDSPGSVNPFFAKTTRDKVAKDFFDASVGTPEKLMEFLKTNPLPKLVLAELLDYQARSFYLNACGGLERLITEYCASKVSEHCIPGAGCPFVEDGSCTEACNRDGPFYAKGCVNLWLELFKYPKNRIPVWRSVEKVEYPDR